MLVDEHAAQLGEPVWRILERVEDDRALVDRQGEKLHVLGEGHLEPVGQLVAARGADDVRQLRGRVGGTGTPASITWASISPRAAATAGGVVAREVALATGPSLPTSGRDLRRF